MLAVEVGRVKLVVLIGVLAIVYAQLYALWDVVAHQSDLSIFTRAAWFIGLLLFPVFATIAYLRMGPGQDRWPPWGTDED